MRSHLSTTRSPDLSNSSLNSIVISRGLIPSMSSAHVSSAASSVLLSSHENRQAGPSSSSRFLGERKLRDSGFARSRESEERFEDGRLGVKRSDGRSKGARKSSKAYKGNGTVARNLYDSRKPCFRGKHSEDGTAQPRPPPFPTSRKPYRIPAVSTEEFNGLAAPPPEKCSVPARHPRKPKTEPIDTRSADERQFPDVQGNQSKNSEVNKLFPESEFFVEEYRSEYSVYSAFQSSESKGSLVEKDDSYQQTLSDQSSPRVSRGRAPWPSADAQTSSSEQSAEDPTARHEGSLQQVVGTPSAILRRPFSVPLPGTPESSEERSERSTPDFLYAQGRSAYSTRALPHHPLHQSPSLSTRTRFSHHGALVQMGAHEERRTNDSNWIAVMTQVSIHGVKALSSPIPVWHAPRVEHGAISFAGTKEYVYVAGQPGNVVVGYSSTSGKPTFRAHLPERVGHVVPHRSALYVTMVDDRIARVNRLRGHTDWMTSPLSGEILQVSPAKSERFLAVLTRTRLYLVDCISGNVVRSKAIKLLVYGAVPTMLSVPEGVVLVGEHRISLFSNLSLSLVKTKLVRGKYFEGISLSSDMAHGSERQSDLREHGNTKFLGKERHSQAFRSSRSLNRNAMDDDGQHGGPRRSRHRLAKARLSLAEFDCASRSLSQLHLSPTHQSNFTIDGQPRKGTTVCAALALLSEESLGTKTRVAVSFAGNLVVFEIATLSVLWHASLPERVSGPVLSHPASILFAASGTTVSAFDTYTGTPMFQFSPPPQNQLPIMDAVLVSDHTLLVTTPEALHAVSPGRGELLWTFSVDATVEGLVSPDDASGHRCVMRRDRVGHFRYVRKWLGCLAK